MQVLQVHQAMAAQAAAKQKEAGALIQAKNDAEVARRTSGLALKLPPSPVKPKQKTVKIADVAPEEDDGVSQASGGDEGGEALDGAC